MDRLCKYLYKGGRCAHGLIDSTECLGEGSCRHANVSNHNKYRDGCSKEHWYGLYCAKYQRFFCAGQDNCGSAEEYFDSMIRSRTGTE